ncbi:MAG: nucleotide disphospho-sugar-binding domain-containing protein [Pseudomonadota bacterium]
MTQKKRVLLTWELGDNFGHIAKLIKMSPVLRRAGFDVFIALQNIAGVAPMLHGLDATILAAPYARIKPPSNPTRPVLTYADDLRPCGYDRPDELAALIRAWDGMYQLVKPDILIVNSSPTALLAAIPYDMFKVNIGLGYEVPQVSQPMPALRYWENNDKDALSEHENSVVRIINAALALLGREPISSIKDILSTDLSLLTTFSDLDHYPLRENGHYVGPFFIEDAGLDIAWTPRRSKDTKRIFAYLSHGQDIEAVIKALHQSPHDVILVARKLSAQNVKILSSNPHLRVFTEPVKIGGLVADADLCITHGGAGTFVQFLLGGIPQIIFPIHIEQLMAAKRVEQIGVGVIGQSHGDARKVTDLIEAVLSNKDYKKQADIWAKIHAGYSVNRQAEEIVNCILSKMAH